MQLQSEGLSPSLRPQLGVGWNRALPAPFSFQNGILPDGVNDQLHVKSLIGSAMPNLISFEMWINAPASIGANRPFDVISNYIASVSGLVICAYIQSTNVYSIAVFDSSLSQFSSLGIAINLSAKNHLAFSINIATKAYSVWVNGQKASGVLAYTTASANTIEFSGLFRKSAVVHSLWNIKIDEARLYNRLLTDDEVIVNYNFRLGNNPSKTEGLLWWYKFENAEVDTALWPSGNPSGWSSGAWGVRDQTNNNRHAMQLNMTNNATLGGAIQAF